MSEPKVIVTLPADQQQIDESGYVSSFPTRRLNPIVSGKAYAT